MPKPHHPLVSISFIVFIEKRPRRETTNKATRGKNRIEKGSYFNHLSRNKGAAEGSTRIERGKDQEKRLRCDK